MCTVAVVGRAPPVPWALSEYAPLPSLKVTSMSFVIDVRATLLLEYARFCRIALTAALLAAA